MRSGGNPSAPRRRVVVINNEPCLLNNLTRLLEAENIAVDAYAKGRLAYRKLREDPPDLILLDQTNYPRGTRLFARLDFEACPPIVFVSPHAEEVQRELGQRGTPAADYIASPFSNKDLIRRVLNLLD